MKTNKKRILPKIATAMVGRSICRLFKFSIYFTLLSFCGLHSKESKAQEMCVLDLKEFVPSSALKKLATEFLDEGSDTFLQEPYGLIYLEFKTSNSIDILVYADSYYNDCIYDNRIKGYFSLDKYYFIIWSHNKEYLKTDLTPTENIREFKAWKTSVTDLLPDEPQIFYMSIKNADGSFRVVYRGVNV